MSRMPIYLCLLLLLVPATAARARMDLELSPIRAELQIDAGVAETNVVQVRNVGDQPVRVRAYLQDWTLGRQGEPQFCRPGSQKKSLAPWLEINPTDFQIRPGQTGEIRYTITVPPGAASGTYWTALMVEGMPALTGPPSPKKMALHGRFAVMLYETVGRPEIKAQFQDFQVTPGRQKLTFSLSLANAGQGHIRPRRSKILLRNQQGQEVAQVEIPDAPVLPGSSREIVWDQEIKLPPGQYLAEARLDIGRRDILVRQQSFQVTR
jgi:P pilus assembly chaperone PapD